MIQDKQISLADLTPEDMELLERGCAGAYDKATAADQLKAVREGNAWIFRFWGDAEGLCVLARGNTRERELMISALAGKNVLAHLTECYELVKSRAKSVGTKRLTGYVSRPGLIAIYKRKTSMCEVASIFTEEL